MEEKHQSVEPVNVVVVSASPKKSKAHVKECPYKRNPPIAHKNSQPKLKNWQRKDETNVLMRKSPALYKPANIYANIAELNTAPASPNTMKARKMRRDVMSLDRFSFIFFNRFDRRGAIVTSRAPSPPDPAEATLE